MKFWKVKCEFCEMEFTSDEKKLAENDLIIHHQENHFGKYLDIDQVEAEEEASEIEDSEI